MIGTVWSLLPPLLAIGLAIATHRVYLSLGLGVVAGTALVAGLHPVETARLLFLHYLPLPFQDWDHIKLLAFTILRGATVGLMNDSGGTAGLVARLVRHAYTKARAQVLAGVAGLVIFFDDYANILILGPTFRPVFDRLRVSRAKLAYIADSTGSADASFALISTWIGFELGLIADALKGLPDPALAALSAYEMFVVSIPYRFYLHLATALIFVIAILGRDFGPMLTSERAAARRRAPAPRGERTARIAVGHWAVAAVPIVLLIVVTLACLIGSGRAKLSARGELAGAGLRQIVGAADSYASLLWAALASFAAALVLTRRRLRGKALWHTLGRGVWVMIPPLAILVLAWALGDLCKDLHTGEFVGRTFGAAARPWAVPTVVFLIGCAMSFATGTSWGTMAVLMPIGVPLAWHSATAAGLDPAGAQFTIMLTIASTLAGAVFGDHCSLISDTTILAALASKCSLVEHFQTQAPYAFLAAIVSVVAGTLPAALGVSVWICLPAGLLVLVLSVRVIGRRI